MLAAVSWMDASVEGREHVWVRPVPCVSVSGYADADTPMLWFYSKNQKWVSFSSPNVTGMVRFMTRMLEWPPIAWPVEDHGIVGTYRGAFQQPAINLEVCACMNV